MVKPPEADPVMPAMMFVVMTAESSGPNESAMPMSACVTGTKPGRLVMTQPNA